MNTLAAQDTSDMALDNELQTAMTQLGNVFPNDEVSITHKLVRRHSKAGSAWIIHSYTVNHARYSEPFFGRTPRRAVARIMTAARITTVQQYIDRKEAQQ